MARRWSWAITTLACLLVWDAHAQSETRDNGTCHDLYEQAVAQLAAEQYSQMLKYAEDRMRLCPDAHSDLILGLAQANMVDALVVADPGEREQLRLAAIRHLRMAAVSSTKFPSGINYTIAHWLTSLQTRGPTPSMEMEAVEPDAPLPWQDEPVIHLGRRAPPPAPQPAFPWGPTLLGAPGVAAVVAGVVLAIGAESREDEANRILKVIDDDSSSLTVADGLALRSKVEDLNEEGERMADWSLGLLVGGGAAVTTALVWYFALEPEGHWRWAATPTGVTVSGRF